MRKIYFAIFFVLLSLSSINAQQSSIKVDDDAVLLNNSKILTYKKINYREHSFYNAKGDELMVIFNKEIKLAENTYFEYFIVNFLKERIKVTFPINEHIYVGTMYFRERAIENMLNWLLDSGVLNTDGSINTEKAMNFYYKYDDVIHL